MDSQKRREAIEKTIMESKVPISASALAKRFHVSRQIIVGDVALLRASGTHVIATPRGYVYEVKQDEEGIVRTIAVHHDEAHLSEEIYTIVDMGGALLDVIVEHPIYGELRGNLHIFSRYDADQFFESIEIHEAKPLSNLTNGLHLHTLRCRDEEGFQRILAVLKDKGFLYEK